jgi:hypothetical protein
MMDELQETFDYIQRIYYSDLSWEAKFDLIFSSHGSQKFCKLARGFDWCDPDTTYEEDLAAFFYAAKSYLYN